MGFTFILDQDVAISHAAKVVNRSALLDNLAAKQTGVPVAPEDNSIDIYEEEYRKVGFSLSDYYLFSKNQYQATLVARTFGWELLGMLSGITCFYIPFWIYGYGVADSSGKTEDLFSIYFAAYQACVFTHHMQMFITIRNFTKVMVITSCISLSMLWPISIIMCNYELFPSDNLQYHLGEIIFD